MLRRILDSPWPYFIAAGLLPDPHADRLPPNVASQAS